MEIRLQNFGKFIDSVFEFNTHLNRPSFTLRNGEGKTTIINGYLFAMTGKTINGFEPQNYYTKGVKTTAVSVFGFSGFSEIKRVIYPNGETALFIDDEMFKQTEFEEVCTSLGIDLKLLRACADINMLAESNVSVETLRSLLIVSDLMDGDELKELRKELKQVREKLAQAKQYALSNVVVPQRTVQELSVSEKEYIADYREVIRELQILSNKTEYCECCKRRLPEKEILNREKRKKELEAYRETRIEEASRIGVLEEKYYSETQQIENAERIIQSAKKAREALKGLEEKEAEINKEIADLSKKDISSLLPAGVTLVTEKNLKNGKTQNCIELCYEGLPIRTVNRAKRIEICATILNGARTQKGLLYVIPLLIDNAEALDEKLMIENVIYFYRG